MGIADEMRARLEAAFAPEVLEIVNDSGRHKGHAGDDGSGESHFSVRIRAPQLAEMGRVQRHRAVNQALGDLVPRFQALALDVG